MTQLESAWREERGDLPLDVCISLYSCSGVNSLQVLSDEEETSPVHMSRPISITSPSQSSRSTSSSALASVSPPGKASEFQKLFDFTGPENLVKGVSLSY